MLKTNTEIVINIKHLKAVSKYIGSNDSVLLTENGILNFSKKLIVPIKGILNGYATIFSGNFLKEVLKEKKEHKFVKVGFKFEFGKALATVERDKHEEWNKEINDFYPQIVPETVLEIPSKTGAKLVSNSTLPYLLNLPFHCEVLFDGDNAFAKYLDAIYKFPNPFKGLKAKKVYGENWAKLKRSKGVLTWKIEGDLLFVFNGTIYFFELENANETIDFPKIPETQGFKVNPKELIKALRKLYHYFTPYSCKVHNNHLTITVENEEIQIPVYNSKEELEFQIPFSSSFFEVFKNFPLIELIPTEEYLFVKAGKMQGALKNENNQQLTPFFHNEEDGFEEEI